MYTKHATWYTVWDCWGNGHAPRLGQDHVCSSILHTPTHMPTRRASPSLISCCLFGNGPGSPESDTSWPTGLGKSPRCNASAKGAGGPWLFSNSQDVTRSHSRGTCVLRRGVVWGRDEDSSWPESMGPLVCSHLGVPTTRWWHLFNWMSPG